MNVSKVVLAALAAGILSGCGPTMTCPRVIFLDGAGWYTGDGSVRAGLRAAGFAGPVERFGWASLLGPLPDHVMAGENHPRVGALADRITQLRRANPDGKLVVMGLSAGTSLIICALERLPEDVQVDYAVLLSPSVSGKHDLTEALGHVKYRLYATSSRHDSLLAAGGSAGLESGSPAGEAGFQLPRQDAEHRAAYRKVVNLPWEPAYIAHGWTGGHLSATSSEFIRVVIAPRILDDLPYPLDQPMVAGRE